MSFNELIENCFDEFMELETALCRIPAPSNHEELRAAFVKDWLSEYGPVYIDDALNVIFTGFDTAPAIDTLHSDLSEPSAADSPVKNTLLICAHTDTVFPDMTPFEPIIDGNLFKCPGAGDDTANLAGMMLLIKYLVQSGMKPKTPVIFAANSGEEGLGNLKGAKELISAYGNRLMGFITLDGNYKCLVNNAVGSHRYKVNIVTPGGHSYSAFGNRSAIAAMAELINDLYSVKVPEKAKTTFNAGVAEGGTSVNTIAQNASFLYEYRSEDMECLEYMKQYFLSAIERANLEKDTTVTYDVLGIRPCKGDVDPEKQQALEQKVIHAIRMHTVTNGIQMASGSDACDIPLVSGSTDCNIPLSVGIPAVCFGLYLGHGAHTREEYIELDSILKGMKIVGTFLEEYFSFDSKVKNKIRK